MKNANLKHALYAFIVIIHVKYIYIVLHLSKRMRICKL